MRWQRSIAWLVLAAAWIGVSVWQLREYRHEQSLGQQTLRRQAESIQGALVGGIRSHRRLGRFYRDQLQGTLDEVAASEDVLAVALLGDDDRILLSAGQSDLLEAYEPGEEDELWEPPIYQLVRAFELLPASGGYGRGGGMHEAGGGPGGMWRGGGGLGSGLGGGRGGGPGGGLGGGPGGGLGPPWRGAGQGPPWQGDDGPDTESPDAESPFWDGGQFAAVLMLDGSQVEEQRRRAAWARGTVIAAGAVVLFCMGLAWHATVRAAEAHGRAQLLESETRHLRDLGQAAAGLAHETRNPLGLVRGWTQRLAGSKLDPAEHRQQAQTVIEECDRVTARINQFLAFARPSQPQPEPVDVGEMLAELATLLEPDLDANELTLQIGESAQGETVRADREMLRQALFNLIRNAVQSATVGGTVEVGVYCDRNGRRRIEVADRGPGVAEEKVDDLFTPYFTTRSNGTGLGLAIVRRIAAAHGWQAGYRPRDGGGSIFYLDGMDG